MKYFLRDKQVEVKQALYFILNPFTGCSLGDVFFGRCSLGAVTDQKARNNASQANQTEPHVKSSSLCHSSGSPVKFSLDRLVLEIRLLWPSLTVKFFLKLKEREKDVQCIQI